MVYVKVIVTFITIKISCLALTGCYYYTVIIMRLRLPAVSGGRIGSGYHLLLYTLNNSISIFIFFRIQCYLHDNHGNVFAVYMFSVRDIIQLGVIKGRI